MSRKLLIVAAALTVLGGGTASAQTMNGVSSVYSRPADMGPHDTATEPSDRDRMINGIRDASVSRSAKAARENAVYSAPAGPRDITVGKAVNDYHGKPIGSVESVQADGAVVSNGAGKVLVPLDAFGRNRKGLMLDVTKDEFDKMVAQANAAPPRP